MVTPSKTTELSALLATSLLFGAIAYLTTSLAWSSGEPSAIRLAGALFLGILLRRRPPAAWYLAYLGLGWLAWICSSVLAGRGVSLSVAFGLARMLELAVAYELLRLARIDIALLKLVDYSKLLLVTIVMAPLTGMVIATAVDQQFRGTIALDISAQWWAGNAAGMLILLPAVLTWDRKNPWKITRAGTTIEACLLLAFSIGTASLALHWLENAFVVISLPLLLIAFRLNLVGSALAGVAVLLTILATHRYWLPVSVGLHSNDGLPLGFEPAIFFALCSIFPSMLISVLERINTNVGEKVLRLSRRIGLIVDNVPALIGYIGRDRVYQFANRRYSDLFGRSPNEIIGMRQDELLEKPSVESFSAHLHRAFSGEQQVFEEAVGDRCLEITYIPDISASGDGGVFVMGHDVTARKSAEQSLFEEKERAQVTLDSIGDGVVTCDTNMRITSINPIAEDMTGWAREEAVGRSFIEIVQLIDIASGEVSLSPLKIAIAENRIVGLQSNSALVRRDGMRTPIEDSAAPIRNRQRDVIGGVMVFHDVSESRAMALKMSHMAQHDYLTDLPNRVLLQDRLQQSIVSVDRAGGGALLFVDIDHFKRVNDTMGHEAGDAVLQQIAHRLIDTMRPDDTVCRQGGDEFALLLPRLAEPVDAAMVAKKVIEAIEKPIKTDGRELRLSASIGIALFPQDSSDVSTLIKQADIALYHAKQAGRGRSSYFASSMSSKAERRMQFETDLRAAIENDEFYLLYQPKVRMPQRKIVGMEALVRWRRSGTGKTISPADFIPAAEEFGLITALDGWVMKEACRQNRSWQLTGMIPVPMSVNVSLSGLDSTRLCQQVKDVLASTGLSPELLEIEFTESAMFSHMDEAEGLIGRLKKLGIRVAMDDFGTGYSSLSYLAALRFDTLKIDQSFVRGLPDDPKRVAIVQAIISLAGALHCGVIAEGVETDAQAECLGKLGCPEMQGYLFSRPVSAEELSGLLRSGAITG